MTKFKTITKILSLSLIIMIIFSVYTAPSGYSAVSSNRIIGLNTDFKDFLDGSEGAQTYQIKVTKPGILKWGCYIYLNYAYLHLLNSKGKEILYKNIYRNDNADYAYEKITLCLEKGTYYLQISTLSSFTGIFRFKNSFKAIGSTEKEKNDSAATANKVSLGKNIVGLIGEDENTDVFRVSVAHKGEVRVHFKAYMERTYLKIFNSSGKQIEYETPSWNDNLLYKNKFSNNLYKYTLSAGTYYFQISEYCGYRGKYELEIYKQKNLNSSKTKVSKIPNYVFTGKYITPKVTVKYNSKKLKEKKDYTLKYAENRTIGASYVYITGKGHYKGTVTKCFDIIPKSVKIKKLINKKGKRLFVKWGKNKDAFGYYIYFSTNKKFKKVKKDYTQKSYITLKNLKKHKTYYIKIKAIQQQYNGHVMIFSKSSPVKKIKIKR